MTASGALWGLLALFTWKLHFVTPAGADPWLFRGGLFATGVATLMVIAAVTHPYTLAGSVLGSRPLRYVGTRSYGLYLYSWPIYQVIREVAGNALTVRQFVVALVITVIVTEFSYTMIEIPVRRREVGIRWRNLRRRSDQRPRKIVSGVIAVSLVLATFGVLRLGLAELERNEIENALVAGRENITTLDELLGSGGTDEGAAAAEPTPTQTTQPSSEAIDGVAPEATTTTTTTTTTLPSEPVSFLAIGDSVMLGAAGVLSARGYTVFAEQNRQLADMIPIMQQLGAAQLFGDPVIIHLGTNGPFNATELDALLQTVVDVPNVLLINIHADRPWTARNNELLASRNQPGDNLILVDWNALAENCEGNCFAADGIHLSAAGQEFYADMIGDVTGL